jgi:hypothetical protein
MDLADLDGRTLLSRYNDRHLDRVLHLFADTALWVREGDVFAVTDFGRELAIVLAKLIDEGHFDDELDGALFDED